jgi:hypothetical protein
MIHVFGMTQMFASSLQNNEIVEIKTKKIVQNE